MIISMVKIWVTSFYNIFICSEEKTVLCWYWDAENSILLNKFSYNSKFLKGIKVQCRIKGEGSSWG